MSGIVVSLRGGPADGKAIELDALAPDDELELQVARAVPFSLTTSAGGSQTLVSGHRLGGSALHRCRIVQRDPPVLEWIGEVGES